METVQRGSFFFILCHFWSSGLFFSSRADVSTYFSASCIPGAAAMAPPLCALCQGQKSYIRQKNYHCETSHSEPFYNSQGALRSGSTSGQQALNLRRTFATFQTCRQWKQQRHGFLLLPLLPCHRCLRSGAGDVAFVDHLALQSIEGKISSVELL